MGAIYSFPLDVSVSSPYYYDKALTKIKNMSADCRINSNLIGCNGVALKFDNGTLYYTTTKLGDDGCIVLYISPNETR